MIVKPDQKRKHLRLDCCGQAVVDPLRGDAGVHGRMIDLSENGCLLALDTPLELGEEATVEICFTARQLTFRVRSRVAVVRSTELYGFEFLAMNRTSRLHVAELIEELAAEKMKQLEGARARSGSEAIELRKSAPVHREKS
jgi:c-di-GMP-binding flagellar brake protein YcgR